MITCLGFLFFFLTWHIIPDTVNLKWCSTEHTLPSPPTKNRKQHTFLRDVRYTTTYSRWNLPSSRLLHASFNLADALQNQALPSCPWGSGAALFAAVCRFMPFHFTREECDGPWTSLSDQDHLVVKRRKSQIKGFGALWGELIFLWIIFQVRLFVP